MHSSIPFIVVSSLLCILAGCSKNPNAYPFTLEEINRFQRHLVPADLNGDDRDELYEVTQYDVKTGNQGIIFYQHDGSTIDQINFEGTIRNKPFFTDFDQDGATDVLIPLLRNDSLFLALVEPDIPKKEIKRGEEFFLWSGKPVQRDSIEYAWDPAINYLDVVSAAPGESPALFVLFATKMAGTPRGIAKFDLPGLSLVDSLFIGARPAIVTEPKDLNKDGTLDLLLRTSAVDNGFSAGGFQDDKAYVLAIDLASMQIILKDHIGFEGEASIVNVGNFSRDKDIQVVAFARDSRTDPKIRTYELSQGKKVQGYSHLVPIQRGIRVKREDNDRLLFLDAKHAVHVLEDDMVSSSLLPRPYLTHDLLAGPDINSDGNKDLYLFTSKGIVVQDNDFKTLALLPFLIQSATLEQVRTGVGEEPLLLLSYGGTTYQYEVHANPFYLLFRYGYLFSLLAGGCLTVLPFVLHRKLSATEKNIEHFSALREASETKAKQQEHSFRNEINALNADLEATKSKVAVLQNELRRVVLPADESPVSMQLKEVLDEHGLEATFDVKSFAHRWGYSRRHLIRVAKELFDLTPDDLRWKYRISTAKILLNSGQYSVTEVSEQTGFKNQSHFSKKFQELEGVSPSTLKSK